VNEPEVFFQSAAMKQAVKEGLKEWLDEKWTEFSGNFTKWALGMFAAAVFAGVIWLVLKSQGWQAPH
jgi:hypothetical protein